MSVGSPSERFLMTVPKPLHKWLSKEAEKLGVTVQDRVRVMLEEQKRIINIARNEELKQETSKIQEKCYSIGKKIYDKFAIERKRLKIITIKEGVGKLYERGIVLPIISKCFNPFERDLNVSLYDVTPDRQFSIENIGKAAKKVAETENQLLSICKREDVVYEALPFSCHIWCKHDMWEGLFRVCLNSTRTPTLADVMKVAS